MVTNNHINYSNEKNGSALSSNEQNVSSKFPRYADETYLDVSARKSIVCNYMSETLL